MTFYDSLLFLHVLSAFAMLGAMTAFWALIGATRPARSSLSVGSIQALARPLSIVVGVGSAGVLVFGIWLALYVDGYELWDAWILASLVLWAAAVGLGYGSDKAFTRAMGSGAEGGADFRRGVLFHAGSTLATVVILALMIFKPGV